MEMKPFIPLIPFDVHHGIGVIVYLFLYFWLSVCPLLEYVQLSKQTIYIK